MEKIPFENLFKKYLKEDGITSGGNYIAWLRHINNHVSLFDKTGFMSEEDLNIIKQKIYTSANTRSTYNDTKGISNLKSTLNKYFLFLNSNFFIDVDIIQIEKSFIPETEKKRLINARLGHGKFRNDVLDLWNNKCAITGISNTQLLITSHIKAWRFSNDSENERLDPHNALPLIPNYDKLFDKYYISFNDNGSIIISNLLSENDKKHFCIKNDLSINIHADSVKYLKHHREQFYLKSP